MPKKANKGTAANKDAVYQVFISHSSADAWIARQMAKELGALEGVQTWLDEKDLEGGDWLEETIVDAIRQSQELLVLVSADSVRSQWVHLEIGVALGARIHVTPILNKVPPDALRISANRVSLDLNRFEQFLVQLRQRIADWRQRL